MALLPSDRQLVPMANKRRWRHAVSQKNRSSTEQHVLRGTVLLLIGLCLAIGAALADAYLHRGIEASDAPPFVLQVSGRGLASNIDLRIYPPEQLESIAAKLKTSGFQYVRQPVSWQDIESEQGVFDWSRYDPMVEELSAHGIGMIAVLADSPAWSRAPEQVAAVDAAPADLASFRLFVQRFTGRYGEKTPVLQIWDLPNQSDHWGGMETDPAEYTALLAEAYAAVETTNPNLLVMLAEFDPFYSSGVAGSDLDFMRGVYQSNGKVFFDIAAAQIDGGAKTPYDRVANAAELSFSRAVLFRELMVEFNDDEKPIWITHYGWDGDNGLDRNAQAAFMQAGINRARAEWPWLGPMFCWALQPQPGNSVEIARALLFEDGASTPAFETLTAKAANMAAVAATGFVPVDASAVTFRGDWSKQHLQNQVFLTTSEVGAMSVIEFEGTGIAAYLRRSPDAGLIGAKLDGAPLPGWPVEGEQGLIDLSFYQAEDITVQLASALGDGRHLLELALIEPGQMTIGGVVVSRDPPARWPIVLLLMAAIVLTFSGLRDLVYAAALHGGVLKPAGNVRGQPSLPRLPDWRPAPRV